MIAHIAEELGINRETLRNWIRKGDDARSAGTTTPTRSRLGASAVAEESPEQEDERLRTQVAEVTAAEQDRPQPHRTAQVSAALDELKRALTGDLWMPPIPASD